jgi:hypothetical protein
MFAQSILWSCVAVGCAAAACEGCSAPSNSAPVGAGGDAQGADAGVCRPVEVSGFVPPSSVPGTSTSLSCNGYNGDAGLVPSYGDACLGVAATYDSCARFAVPDGGGAAACYACLVTPAGQVASSYGVVVAAAIPVVNYGACIETVAPTAAGRSCALALTAAAKCADYACKPTCPVFDEASFSAYATCTNDALYGACVGYTLESLACLAAEQGDGGTPVASTCFAGATAEDHYLSIAHFLCGGG